MSAETAESSRHHSSFLRQNNTKKIPFEFNSKMGVDATKEAI